MRKLVLFSLMAGTALSLASCFRDIDITFDAQRQVELEEAVRRTPATGQTFPIIDVTRMAGVQTYQVNLVGAKLTTPSELTYSVDTAIAPLLNATTIRAVEGVHYRLDNGGKITLKADTSFAAMRLNVLNPGAAANRRALVLLRLDGNDQLRPAENYRRLAVRINLN